MNQENFDVPKQDYFYLWEIISFEGFRFDRYHYSEDEVNVLQPRLEAQGYTDVEWSMGEWDSYGPLTRVCTCKNPEGEIVRFVYG